MLPKRRVVMLGHIVMQWEPLERLAVHLHVSGFNAKLPRLIEPESGLELRWMSGESVAASMTGLPYELWRRGTEGLRIVKDTWVSLVPRCSGLRVLE